MNFSLMRNQAMNTQTADWGGEESIAYQFAPGANFLLTAREVASILKVPVSWVYKHTRPECGNPLPHIKVGKYLRFLPSDIREYLITVQSRSRRNRR